MSNWLTDEELEKISRTRWQHVREVATPGMVAVMAAELRQRRAADLTTEEREALVFARDCVHCAWTAAEDDADEGCAPTCEWRDRAFAVLDRLLEKAGER